MNYREFFNQMAPQWDEQVRHDACKLSRIVAALSLQSVRASAGYWHRHRSYAAVFAAGFGYVG